MQRESRFTVLKNKDIAAYLVEDEREQLNDLCRKINRSRLLAGKGIVQCVVVESNCPEYEKVWELLAARAGEDQ